MYTHVHVFRPSPIDLSGLRAGVTAVANDRTRFEIYYPAYEGAIKAGVGSFMCSYNKINTNLSNPTQPGTFACENEQTLLADLKVGLVWVPCTIATNTV